MEGLSPDREGEAEAGLEENMMAISGLNSSKSDLFEVNKALRGTTFRGLDEKSWTRGITGRLDGRVRRRRQCPSELRKSWWPRPSRKNEGG